MGSCCATPAADELEASELQADGNAKAKKGVQLNSDDVARAESQVEAREEAPLATRKGGKMVTKTQGEMDKITAARGRGHREGVSAEVMTQDSIEHFVKPVYPKTAAEEVILSDIIRKNEKMEVMCGSLSGDALKDVVNAFFSKTVNKGEDVIRQGAEGDLLYICEEGQLDIFVARADPDTMEMPQGKGDLVVSVGSGVLFGELALMYSAPRAATVTVSSSTAKLWALERDAFKHLLVAKGQRQFQVYQGYLREVELLQPFNNHELSQIADMMESNLYDGDEVIVQQGDVGESFFIVEDGTCCAVMSGSAGDQEVKTYKAGDYFGEIALLTDEPRRATVKATGQGATVLSISKEDFSNAFGPIADTLKKNIDKYPKYAEFLKARSALSK